MRKWKVVGWCWESTVAWFRQLLLWLLKKWWRGRHWDGTDRWGGELEHTQTNERNEPEAGEKEYPIIPVLFSCVD